MKIVEFYEGTNCVQLCYDGFYWLTGMDKLNAEAEKLRTDARRICKAVGVHNEFCEYDVTLNLEDRKIYVAISGERKVCDKIVAEARKRHFTLGNK